ncbi:methylated-DNA--[protein]-cysteine S-methyltransferase [Aliikangiella maris]|uniref:Methylated-DNA--[protein]-cysteine S-methyltransferase n=2 Tax=Aliikangiella maris TaxID=3162458 RepID=A0ABV2BNJ1_9GAMM
MTKNITVIASPIGNLAIYVKEAQLKAIEIGTELPLSDANDSASQLICAQIGAYFSKQSNSFKVPIYRQGTDFQQRVWRALTRIPAGEVRTYGQIAAELGSSARAVGTACRKNPTPVIVPCHRVVSATGIGGFSGQQVGHLVDIKRQLLMLEGVNFE